MIKNIRIILSLLLLILIVASCKNVSSNGSTKEASEGAEEKITTYDLKVGDSMPNIVVETNKGTTFDLSKVEKPVLVNFWATWCPPCRAEMPGLQNLYDEYKDKIDFVMINVGETNDDISAFLNENNTYTFPIGYDPNTRYAETFKITGIPTTFIVGKDKVIKSYIIGMESENNFKNFIEKAINE